MSEERKVKPHTSYDGAVVMATRLWKLLGSKTKWRDDVPEWVEILGERWMESGLSRDDFEAVMTWALTENEYTARNLRLAKNPARSLFVNQWDNILLFMDADMAGRKARARRGWKHGACCRCGDEPAESRPGDWCKKCAKTSERLGDQIAAAVKKGLFRHNKESGEWSLWSGVIGTEAHVISSGVYSLREADISSVATAIRMSAHSMMLLDNAAIESLNEILGAVETEGFDTEEA